MAQLSRLSSLNLTPGVAQTIPLSLKVTKGTGNAKQTISWKDSLGGALSSNCNLTDASGNVSCSLTSLTSLAVGATGTITATYTDPAGIAHQMSFPEVNPSLYSSTFLNSNAFVESITSPLAPGICVDVFNVSTSDSANDSKMVDTVFANSSLSYLGISASSMWAAGKSSTQCSQVNVVGNCLLQFYSKGDGYLPNSPNAFLVVSVSPLAQSLLTGSGDSFNDFQAYCSEIPGLKPEIQSATAFASETVMTSPGAAGNTTYSLSSSTTSLTLTDGGTQTIALQLRAGDIVESLNQKITWTDSLGLGTFGSNCFSTDGQGNVNCTFSMPSTLGSSVLSGTLVATFQDPTGAKHQVTIPEVVSAIQPPSGYSADFLANNTFTGSSISGSLCVDVFNSAGVAVDGSVSRTSCIQTVSPVGFCILQQAGGLMVEAFGSWGFPSIMGDSRTDAQKLTDTCSSQSAANHAPAAIVSGGSISTLTESQLNSQLALLTAPSMPVLINLGASSIIGSSGLAQQIHLQLSRATVLSNQSVTLSGSDVGTSVSCTPSSSSGEVWCSYTPATASIGKTVTLTANYTDPSSGYAAFPVHISDTIELQLASDVTWNQIVSWDLYGGNAGVYANSGASIPSDAHIIDLKVTLTIPSGIYSNISFFLDQYCGKVTGSHGSYFAYDGGDGMDEHQFSYIAGGTPYSATYNGPAASGTYTLGFPGTGVDHLSAVLVKVSGSTQTDYCLNLF